MSIGEHLAKTLPLLQKASLMRFVMFVESEMTMIMFSFVTLSQLIPCLKQMRAGHWSMIVF